ncbi:ribonuclease H protein, partial [Trifolium medium]|nr:ribonuclease H protein [Trifolium medium]
KGGFIGCGGIISEDEDEWLDDFAKCAGKGNAVIVELWDVFEGLQYARRLNFQAVELHDDSMVVVQIIWRNEIGSLHGKTFVEMIRRLIDLNWEVVVHHSYCETKLNQYTDALTNYGCEMTYSVEKWRLNTLCFEHNLDDLWLLPRDLTV